MDSQPASPLPTLSWSVVFPPEGSWLHEPKKPIVVLPGWWFELLVAAVAAVTLVLIILSGVSQPSWPAVVVFAGMFFVGENTSIALGSAANVSPGFMIVMA